MITVEKNGVFFNVFEDNADETTPAKLREIIRPNLAFNDEIIDWEVTVYEKRSNGSLDLLKIIRNINSDFDELTKEIQRRIQFDENIIDVRVLFARNM